MAVKTYAQSAYVDIVGPCEMFILEGKQFDEDVLYLKLEVHSLQRPMVHIVYVPNDIERFILVLVTGCATKA